MLEIYILDVEELFSQEADSSIYEEIEKKIDDTRLAILHRASKNAKVRALEAGAGLLIQYGYEKFRKSIRLEETVNDYSQNEVFFSEVTVSDVLSDIVSPVNFEYKKSEEGKPYIENVSDAPSFNLSHSGTKVCIALAQTEIGVDIQLKKNKRIEELSERFFNKNEIALIKELGNDVFFTLWSRKESWGKCEGCGVRPALDKDFSDISSPENSQYIWKEAVIGEYVLVVCCKRD